MSSHEIHQPITLEPNETAQEDVLDDIQDHLSLEQTSRVGTEVTVEGETLRPVYEVYVSDGDAAEVARSVESRRLGLEASTAVIDAWGQHVQAGVATHRDGGAFTIGEGTSADTVTQLLEQYKQWRTEGERPQPTQPEQQPAVTQRRRKMLGLIAGRRRVADEPEQTLSEAVEPVEVRPSLTPLPQDYAQASQRLGSVRQARQSAAETPTGQTAEVITSLVSEIFEELDSAEDVYRSNRELIASGEWDSEELFQRLTAEIAKWPVREPAREHNAAQAVLYQYLGDGVEARTTVREVEREAMQYRDSFLSGTGAIHRNFKLESMGSVGRLGTVADLYVDGRDIELEEKAREALSTLCGGRVDTGALVGQEAMADRISAFFVSVYRADSPLVHTVQPQNSAAIAKAGVLQTGFSLRRSMDYAGSVNRGTHSNYVHFAEPDSLNDYSIAGAGVGGIAGVVLPLGAVVESTPYLHPEDYSITAHTSGADHSQVKMAEIHFGSSVPAALYDRFAELRRREQAGLQPIGSNGSTNNFSFAASGDRETAADYAYEFDAGVVLMRDFPGAHGNQEAIAALTDRYGAAWIEDHVHIVQVERRQPDDFRGVTFAFTEYAGRYVAPVAQNYVGFSERQLSRG